MNNHSEEDPPKEDQTVNDSCCQESDTHIIHSTVPVNEQDTRNVPTTTSTTTTTTTTSTTLQRCRRRRSTRNTTRSTTTGNPCRVVSFCETVQVIQDGSEPITKQEKKMAWYQASEFQHFKVEIKATIRLLLKHQRERRLPNDNDNDNDDIDNDDSDEIDNDDSNKDQDQDQDHDHHDETNSIDYYFCTWGLDRIGTTSERQRQRHTSIRAVLLEQELVRQEQDQKQQQLQQQQQQQQQHQLQQQQQQENQPNADDDHTSDDTRRQCKGYDNDDNDDKQELELEEELDVVECIARAYRYHTTNSAEAAYWMGLKYAKEQPDRVMMNFCAMLAQENKLLVCRATSSSYRLLDGIQMRNGSSTAMIISTGIPPPPRRRRGV